MKNSSDTIGNRTRDLPTCSAVPQPTAPPRAPPMNSTIGKYMQYNINILYNYTFSENKLAKHGAEIKTRMWTAWTKACASVPGKGKTCLSFIALRLAIGSTQLSSHCLSGALSKGLRRWRNLACHSFLFSTKIRNVWSCTSYPPHAFVK